MRLIVSLPVLIALAVAVAACGTPSATPGASRAPSASAAGASAAAPSAAPSAAAASAGAPAAGAGAVAIVDFAFDPTAVSVKAGTKVTWTNTGAAVHTVKWSDGTPESSQLKTGDTYDRTFAAAGTFGYVCGIHGSMAGTITVTP